MKVLVVVDMQDDFVTGPLGTPEAKAIVKPIANKIQEYNANKDWVLFTQDTHFSNYFDTLEGKMLPIPHCLYKENGWDIVYDLSKLVVRDGKSVIYSDIAICMNRIYKETFGSDILVDFWKETENEIESVEFCGVCTDICVVSNVLAARQAMPNMPITVNANLCAGTTPANHQAALTVMRSCQINVVEE